MGLFHVMFCFFLSPSYFISEEFKVIAVYFNQVWLLIATCMILMTLSARPQKIVYQPLTILRLGWIVEYTTGYNSLLHTGCACMNYGFHESLALDPVNWFFLGIPCDWWLFYLGIYKLISMWSASYLRRFIWAELCWDN